jgi:hypothetical protein
LTRDFGGTLVASNATVRKLKFNIFGSRFMKKLLLLSALFSCLFMVSFAGEGKKSGHKKDRIEKYKNMTDEEKAELKAKRIEKITERLKTKGKTDAEIAEILKKIEDRIQERKAKMEAYKDKLKAEGKTDEEIAKLVAEKRHENYKKAKKLHKHKKNKE